MRKWDGEQREFQIGNSLGKKNKGIAKLGTKGGQKRTSPKKQEWKGAADMAEGEEGEEKRSTSNYSSSSLCKTTKI